MSNVYVVWFDNGESWEDNFRCIEKIFSTREAAEKYLDDGYVRTKDNLWEPEYYTCKIRGDNNCSLCDKYNAWIDSDYDVDAPCEEYDKLPDNYEHPSWDIQVYEVVD